MKIRKQFFALAFLPLALGSTNLHAQESQALHLAERAQNQPTLNAQYQALIKPFVKQSAWLSNYGTTSPGVAVQIDGQPYTVYWGCKPHNCISESYAMLVDATNQLRAGGFIRNHFDGPALSHSNISWLGDTQWDFARTLMQYLY